MDWISRKRFITVMIFSACGFSWMWKIGELGGLAAAAGGTRWVGKVIWLCMMDVNKYAAAVHVYIYLPPGQLLQSILHETPRDTCT